MPIKVKSYINGQWKEHIEGKVKTRYNPADTREVLYTYQEATDAEALEVIDIAQAAYPSWKKTPASKRGEYLFEIARLLRQEKEELATVIVREEGKTYNDAVNEVGYAAGIIEFYAGTCRRLKGTIQDADIPNVQIETKPEALGVVLIITPWNFPLSIPAWKIAPAIASGNTAVLKTSSETPYTAMKLMEIIEKADLPEGVVNHVLVPGKTVPKMIQHKAVKAVTFTGSNSVGNRVYQEAAKEMKRCLLEMGGKNPLIVMEDADIDEAVQIAAAGAYGQTGQACTATGRIIVHEDIAESFTNKLVEHTKQIKVGNGLDESVAMGPHVSESELQSTLDFIESAKEEGATLLTGGSVPSGEAFENGHFIEPTVFTNVSPTMRIAREEVFGPVSNIIKIKNIEEAISVANDVDYGLSSAICTYHLPYINKALAEIEAGIIKVNMTTTGTFFQAPFGGRKASSTNTYKELGEESLDFYLQSKTRYIKSKEV